MIQKQTPKTMKTEGRNYQATRDLDIKEIAKLIRKDLKDPIFEGFKFSVYIDRFSMGQAINCEVVQVPEMFALINPNYDLALATNSDMRGISRYNENALGLLEVLRNTIEAYNFDRSDAYNDYFDSKFYTRVSFDYKLTN
jgi:hypothetical protein